MPPYQIFIKYLQIKKEKTTFLTYLLTYLLTCFKVKSYYVFKAGFKIILFLLQSPEC